MKYTVISTTKYDKSFKKIQRSGKLKQQAKNKLEEAVDILASGKKLPPQYEDHQLVGELKKYRECHIKGDLLLVY